MAFDAIMVRALTKQLRDSVINSKIDKIHQPEKDEITIYLRNINFNAKLLICASPSNSRVQFLNGAKTNPLTAPNFCMLLRKHLAGGKITDIVQHDFERIIDFFIECRTEMGDLTTRHLICEIMGRHSNIILTDSAYKISDSIKHVDFYTSSVRQILPGLIYKTPAPQDKINPLEYSKENLKKRIDDSGSVTAVKFILNNIDGFCALNAREICKRANVDQDKSINLMSGSEKDAFLKECENFFEDIIKCRFCPCIVSNGEKFVDFSAFEITQYGEAAQILKFDNASDAVDKFYLERDSAERKKQKSAGILKVVSNNIERCAKKINLLKNTLDDAQKRDKYKMCGDLINANLYKIERGAKYFEAENFYKEGQPKEKINLDSSLSPQANAQKYYKKYTKAKVAAEEAKKQLGLAEEELSYLKSVEASIAYAKTEQDINAIKEELSNEGYVQKRASGKRKNQPKQKPMHFTSSEGFEIYVGKNNIQNDILTLKTANSSDLWFHTKNFPGSHTVIKFGIDKNAGEKTIFEAATIAATYSSARSSANVPVDYTEIKNVKKPNGAKPGMVIYDKYNTLYVTPDEKLCERLLNKTDN